MDNSEQDTAVCLDLYIETLEEAAKKNDHLTVTQSSLRDHSNSSRSSLDIYSDLDDDYHNTLWDEAPDPCEDQDVKSKLSLQEFHQIQAELQHWKMAYKDLESKFCALNKNMFSLCLTARREVACKDAEIAQLKKSHIAASTKSKVSIDQAVQADLLAVAENNVQKMRYALPCLTEDCTVLSTRHKDACESFAVFTDKAEDCTVLSTSHIDTSESFADKATSLITDIKTSYNSRSFSLENSSVRKSPSSPDSTLHTNSHLNTWTMKRIPTLGSGSNICSASVSDIIPTASSSSSVSPSLCTDTDLCSVLNCPDGASNLSIPSNFANSTDKINSFKTNSLTGTVLPSTDISIADVACAKTCTGTVSTLHSKMHQFTLPQSDVVSKDGSIYNKTEDFMVMVSDILLPAQHQNNDKFNIDTDESAAQDLNVVSVVQALGNVARPLQENNSAEVTVPVIHPFNDVTHKVSSAEAAVPLNNPLKAVTHKVSYAEVTIPIAHPLNAVTHKVSNAEVTVPISHPLNAVTHKVSSTEATIPIAHPLNSVTNKVSSAETTVSVTHPLNALTNKVSSAETTVSVTHPLNPLTHKVSSTEATVPTMQHVENITFDSRACLPSRNEDKILSKYKRYRNAAQGDSTILSTTAKDMHNDLPLSRVDTNQTNMLENVLTEIKLSDQDKANIVSKCSSSSSDENNHMDSFAFASTSVTSPINKLSLNIFSTDILGVSSIGNKQSAVQKDAKNSEYDILEVGAVDSIRNKQPMVQNAGDSVNDMLVVRAMDSFRNKQSAVQKDAEDSVNDMLIDSVRNKQSTVQKDAEDSVNDTLKISAICIKNKRPTVQECAEDLVNDVTPIGGLLRSSVSGSLNNITPCESGIVECIEIINAKERREFERDFDHVDVKHEADAEMECTKHVPDKCDVSLKYLCNSRSCKHKKSQESRYKKVNTLRLSKISFVKKKNKEKLKIKSTVPFILKQTNWHKSRKACNLKKLLAKRKLDEGIKRKGLHLPSKDSNVGFNKENLFVPKEDCKLVYNAVELFVPGHDSVEENLYIPNEDRKRVPSKEKLFVPNNDCKCVPYEKALFIPSDEGKHPNKVLPALRDDHRCAHGVLPSDDSKETLNEVLGVPNENSKVALHMPFEKNSQVPNEDVLYMSVEGDKLVPCDEHKDGCHKADDLFLPNGKFQNCSHTTNESTKFKERLFAPSKDRKFEKDTHTVNKRTNIHQKLKQSNRMPKHSLSFKNTRGKQDILNGRNRELMRNGKRKMKSKTNAAYICEQKEVRSKELASEYKKKESNTIPEEIYLVHNTHLSNYTPTKKYKYISDSSVRKMSAELYTCETVKEKTDKLTNYKKGNSPVGIPEISLSQSVCEQTDLQEPSGDIATIDKMLEKCITSTDDSDISIYTDESDGEQLMTAVHFRDRATYISLPVESSVLQPSYLDCDDSVDICDIVSSQLSNLAEPVKENNHYLSENVTYALPMIPYTKDNCSEVCAVSPISFSAGQRSSPDCHFLGNSHLKVFSESSSLARTVTLQADVQVSRSSDEDSDKIDIEKTFCGENQDSLIINMTHNCLVNDQDHNATSDANISSSFFKCSNLSPVLSDATFSSKSDLELKCQNSCTSNTSLQDESRKLEPVSSFLWSPEKSMMSYSRQQPMSSRSFETFLGISSSNTMLDDSITQTSFFTISCSTEKNRQENDDCVKDSLIDSDNVQVHGKIETVEQDKNQTDYEAIISHRNVSTFGFNSLLSSEGQPISNFCVKQLSAKQDDKITPVSFSFSSTYSDQEKINTAPFSFLSSSALNSSTFSSHCSSYCANSSVLRQTKDNMPPRGVTCARDEAIESSSGFPHSFDAKQTFSLSTDLKRYPARHLSFSRTDNLSGKQQQRFGTHDSEKLMVENIVQDLGKIDAGSNCEAHIPFNCVKTVIQNICHESLKLDRQVVNTNGVGGSQTLSSNPLYNTTLDTAKGDLEDGELESIESGNSCGHFSMLGDPTHTFYSGSLEEGEVLSSDVISDPHKSDVRFVSHTFGLMDSDNAKFLDIHDILKCQRQYSSQDNGNSIAPGMCSRNEKLGEATGKALINTTENSSESKQIGNTENHNYMIYKNCQPNLSQDPCKQIVNNPCREADVNSSRQLVISPGKASYINQDMGSGRSTHLNQSSKRKYPQPLEFSSHENNVLPNLSLVQSENREIEKHFSMESNESGFAVRDWLSIQNVKLHPLEKNKSLFSLAPKEPEVMCSSLSGIFPTCSSIHTYQMVSHRNSSEKYMRYQIPKKTYSLGDEFSETVSEHVIHKKTVGCQGFLATTVSQQEEELIVDDLKVHGNSLIEELPGCARTRVFKSLNHPNTFIKDELVHVEEVASGKDDGEQEICENICDVSDQENCSFEDFSYLGNHFRTDSNKNKSVKERQEEKSCDKSKEEKDAEFLFADTIDVKCSNDTLDKKIPYCGRNSSDIDDFNQESLLDENNKPNRLDFSISNNDHLYEENLITNSDGKVSEKGHTSHKSFPLNDKAPGQNQTMTNKDDELIEYMNNSKDSSRLVKENCGKKKSESLKTLRSSVTHLEDDFQTSFDHQNLQCVKQESGYVTSSLPCSNTRRRSLSVDHLSLGTSAESLTLLEELHESSCHESLVVSSDSRKEIQKKEQTNQEKRKCFMSKNIEFNNNSDSEKTHSSIENIRCVVEKSSLTNGQVKDSLQHNEERKFCVKSIQDPVDKGGCKSVLPEYIRKRESSYSRKSKGSSKSLLPEYTRKRESSYLKNSKGVDKSLLPEYTRKRESSYRRKSKGGCKSLLPEYTRKRESSYTKPRDCLQHVKSRDSYKHHDRNDTLEFPHMSDCHGASRMASAPCSCSIMTTCKCSQTFLGSSSCLKQKSNHHSERYSECNKLNHSSVDKNFNRDYQKSCSCSKNCSKSHLLNRPCYDHSRTRPDMVDAKQCDLRLDQRSLPKKRRSSISFSESGGYKQHRRDQTALKTENDMKETSDESQLGIYTTHSCYKVNKCQHDCSIKDSYFNSSKCSKHGHNVRQPCNDCCKNVSRTLMECQVDLKYKYISKTKKDNDRRQCHLDKQEIERQRSENTKSGSSRSPRSRSSKSRSSRSRSPRSRTPGSRSSSKSKGTHKR